MSQAAHPEVPDKQSELVPDNGAAQAAEPQSDPERFVVDPGVEAKSYFSKFSVDHFMPEYAFNSDVPGPSWLETSGDAPPVAAAATAAAAAATDVAPPSESADILADDAWKLEPNPVQGPVEYQFAQWSAEGLNPYVLQFPSSDDDELDRQSSGASVLEEGSVLGESGRTYTSYKGDTSAYLLPNDPAEQDRLDMQHAMITYLLDGRLVLAPLPRAPRLVLDVATGTGIWALEFARANPSSFVVGTDIARIQPAPDVPNCLFERIDCEEDWLWSCRYDYIHIRMIVSAIRDPARLIRQAYEYLAPGGWLEMGDAYNKLLSYENEPEKDDRVASSHMRRLGDIMSAGAAAVGVDLGKVTNYKKWLIEAGFKDVKEVEFRVPCSPWPTNPKAKRVGQWVQANYLAGLRGVAFKLLRAAGMGAEEVEEFVRQVKEEIQRAEIRGYTPYYIVYGRKPFNGET
ncbi:S-adenosyl-L-methionine-dependent methyltransferase [Xylariales sp. PMI_506]|nr:S-adenosyl-L-methionine-dependent methyltransferase [Xylariales sp. PMI_506]